ncbi:MAG: methyltransferase family protein [Candidatus Promineifilaceae bacterium]
MKTIRGWWIDKGGSYVVVQFMLFAAIYFAPGTVLGAWGAFWDGFGRIFGSILIMYGLLMLSFGTINLGRNLQAEPHPKENATLVTSGAYRVVRHPIYSGIIIGWIGWGLFSQAELTALLALMLLLPFFDIKTRREERMLAAKFPAYAAYQTQVRKLIPFVY